MGSMSNNFASYVVIFLLLGASVFLLASGFLQHNWGLGLVGIAMLIWSSLCAYSVLRLR
jgi:membrane-bound ClpP family serine protease